MILKAKPSNGQNITLADLRALIEAVDQTGGDFAESAPIMALSPNNPEPISLESLSVEGEY